MQLGQKVAELLQPGFKDLGLALDTFVVENLSMPDELQKILDQRIGMNMVGDMNRYTQFEVAQSIPVAAANEGGGGAGIGAGLGAGMGMAQAIMGAMRPGAGGGEQPSGGGGSAAPAGGGGGAAAGHDTKFCVECGKPMPRTGKFCPECGKAQ
jgi:membrane protease subunit (stomatin/prohibitin family)